MTYAEDLDAWTLEVCRSGRCTWPGCSSIFGLGGHHVIRRGISSTRLLVENGVCLCQKHHNLVEGLKGTKAYERIMILLIGRRRWDLVNEIARKELEGLVPVEELEMPSSDIEF